jgi:hypothetical protein
MRIRMRVLISGTRDGQEWPARGSVFELPDGEAQDLIRAGMAEPVTTFRDAETATTPPAEVRTPPAPPAPPKPAATLAGDALRRSRQKPVTPENP